MIRFEPDEDFLEIACDRAGCPSTDILSRGAGLSIRAMLFAAERAGAWSFARDPDGDIVGALCRDCVRDAARARRENSFRAWWKKTVAPRIERDQKARALEKKRAAIRAKTPQPAP